METTSVLKDANLHWFYLDSAKYAKYENLGHIFLSCSVGEKTSSSGLTRRILSDDDKSRLASIYAKHSAPISCSVSFGGVLWANIVGESSFPPFPVQNGSASSGSFSKMKPTPMMSMELNDRFVTLEYSLASFAKYIDKLVKRLDLSGPIVFQSSPGYIVISESSGVAIGGKIIAEVVVIGSSVISKMKKTLNNLSIMVMGLLAKIDNADLVWKIATCNVCGINVSVKQKDVICWHVDSGSMVSIVMETKLRSNIRPWIINKFDRVKIFFSGLDKKFLGTRVAIIINNSFARHVSKIEEIPGHLVSVWLFFKNKLLVIILGLYVGASAETRFGQVCKINFIIAKTANSSMFMVLGSNFNKDGSRKSASFKFCLDLGKNLSSMLAGHKVTPVSDFFNTDHNAVLVSVGLSGLLDAQLNDIHFREHSLDKFLEYMDMFNVAKDTKNLDAMWKIFKKVVISSADSVFSRHWFSKFDCQKNKLSSKFFKLELLVAKLVKCLSLGQKSEAVCLFKVWSTINSKRVSKGCTMFDNSESRESIFQHLLRVKKLYRKSKYYESKMTRDISIRKAIDKHIKIFSSNKEHMIKSVLEWPFKKVVLDHLIVDDKLILEPKKVLSAVNDIMERWTKK
ncbi:hypothetical protein G9A89_006143 [Geosiphon pyriformis]|nr:hypothetical protein G9A89_006143 [Geosiphon pyriformis]